MNSKVRNLTYDFLENERGVFGEVQSDNNEYQDSPIIDAVSKIVETVNTELVEQEELRDTIDQLESSEISILIDSKTDFSGRTPKRYTTKCFLVPKTVPYWYNESVLLFINSSKKVYEEKIYFKEKVLPHKYSEEMWTEVVHQHYPSRTATIDIPIADIYIPLGAA